MQTIISRYRNITVLMLVLGAQLFLLAYQLKSQGHSPRARVWAMSGVMPLAKFLGFVHANTIGAATEMFRLVGVREENERLKKELGELRVENRYLKGELGTADRTQALAAFAARSPSKHIVARIVGAGTGANSRVVFLDRGASSGIERGMAVITPNGIVGRVNESQASSAQVVLVTDPAFATGVVSQKNRVLGVLKGRGQSTCLVDYVRAEDNIEEGEWLFTSGDERVFPKGLPAGRVVSARHVRGPFREIVVEPSGLRQGYEEVLVVIEGVHQALPDPSKPFDPLLLLEPPPRDGDGISPGVGPESLSTEADSLIDKYRRIGAGQGHKFGAGGTPDFNLPAADKVTAASNGREPVPPAPPETARSNGAPPGQGTTPQTTPPGRPTP